MKLSFAALVLVTGITPLATDTYIAGLPSVQPSLHTSATVAQLTMTAFILGLAAGQLLCGPIGGVILVFGDWRAVFGFLTSSIS